MNSQPPTLALILDSIPYREADLVVRLFHPQLGAISAMALSARRSKTRFASGVDRISLAEVLLSGRGERMALLKEAHIRDGYWGIKADFDATMAASLLCELLMKSHVEEGEAADLLTLALRLLEELEQGQRQGLYLLLLRIAAQILAHLRFLPARVGCDPCALDPTPDSTGLQLNLRTGQFSCSRHADSGPGLVSLSPNEIGVVREALAPFVPHHATASDALAPTAADNERAKGVLDKLRPLLHDVFGGDLKSLRFVSRL